MRPIVTVKSTGGKHGEAGLLRIDFLDDSGQGSLEEIAWDEFFEIRSGKTCLGNTRKKPLRAKRAILTSSCLANQSSEVD